MISTMENQHDPLERILILAPTGRDAAVLADRLQVASLTSKVFRDITELLEAIERGAGTALIAEESLSSAVLEQLTATLKRQPPWSDFPLIIMTSSGEPTESTWRIVEAMQDVGHATLLERPVRGVTLISAVRVALQSRRRQYQVRDHLEKLQLAESSLRDSERRMRLITDGLPVLIAYCDRNETYRFCNREYERWFGLKSESIIGRTVREVIGGAAYRELQPHIRRVLTGECLSLDAQLPYNQGPARHVHLELVPHVDVPGQVRGYYAMVQDVTARVQAENALRNSEARFRQLADAMPQIVWTASRNGAREFVNRQWSERTGTPVEAALGWRWMDLLHPDDRPGAEIAVRKMASGEEFELEYRLRQCDGSYRWFLARAVAAQGGGGDVRQWFGTCTDIDAHKEAQSALQDINETLEEQVANRTLALQRQAARLRRLANQLTEVEQSERKRLAQTLHDHLQQIVVAAKMHVGIARRQQNADSVLNYLNTIEGLLDQTIQTSRSLAVDLSPPILNDAPLPETLEWLARWVQSNHGLRVKVESNGSTPILAENAKTFVFQAVRELLFNTVKHAGADAAYIRLRKSDDGCLEIDVEDHGCGFDPGILEAHRSVHDGLGLFNVRERLEALGGAFEVASKPGDGARFRMTVPTLSPAPRNSHRLHGVAEFTERRRSDDSDGTSREAGALRVLVVDDHKIVREGLVSMLKNQPEIEVVGEASNGEEAVLSANQLKPDVIVMDVTMPKLNGVEATRCIRREHPEIRIIGLSLHEEQDMATAMKEAGATAYLTKGGPADELFRTIREVALAE